MISFIENSESLVSLTKKKKILSIQDKNLEVQSYQLK